MKKAATLLLLIFFYTQTYSHPFPFDEITLRSGNKTKIKPQSFRIDMENKSISFTDENTNKTLTLNFKDFTTVTFGVNKFEIIKTSNQKQAEGYFVIAENQKYKLITRTLPSTDDTTKSYIFLILDSSNNDTIEEHSFDNKINQKSANARSDIYGKIKFYFPENPQLIKRLELYDRNSYTINNTSILNFFNTPIYFKNN